MILRGLASYSWLQICLGFVLLNFIHCDCPFPRTKISHGTYLYAKSRSPRKAIAPEGYVLRFKCEKGYLRIGPKYMQCEDGEWLGEVPRCERMECSDPPVVKHAAGYKLPNGTVPTSFPLQTELAYSCNFGYELSDDTTTYHLLCHLNEDSNEAEWKGKLPSCLEKKSCPDPGVSVNGARDANCVTKNSLQRCFVGTVLRYTCSDGYELVGDEEITCLSNEQWSSSRPLCKPLDVHCELPPEVPNGMVTGEKDGDYFLPGAEARILCADGFKHEGPDEFVWCDESGEWSDEFGECVELSCDRPDPLENGTISELLDTNSTSFPYESQLTYECDRGYRLTRGDSWRICGKTGWSGKTPVCEEIRCPDPGVPEHGEREGNNFEVGATVLFRCFTGYQLLGSFERYCMPNGQWNGKLARCDIESNYCPNPGIPINGYKNSTDYNLGDFVGFRCASGYIHLGSQIRECLPNRTWSGSETKCVGAYDFDNKKEISDILKTKLSQQFDEESEEKQRNLEAVQALFRNGTGILMKTLDLSYQGRLIIYFAFDVSGSIGRHNFEKSIEFAKAIVKKVGISQEGARVGTLTFGSDANNVFLPMHFHTTEDVINNLDAIEYTGGGTAASSALTLIKENIALEDEQEGFDKRNKKDVVFILTDGKANMGGNPEREADNLKKIGVDIYCVGITGDPHIESLYKIASNSKYGKEERPNVFILDNYNSMSWLVQEITNGTLDYSECGLGMENIGIEDRGRIAGGRNSSDPWPWMAALFFMPIGGTVLESAKLRCGGSIIHRNFILTAAHCFYEENLNTLQINKRRAEEIIVKLGLYNTKDETTVQDYGVTRIIMHENFHPGRIGSREHDYDIALLQLDRPIEFGPLIRPVCLPPRELPEDSPLYSANGFGWATGWGHRGIIPRNENNVRIILSQSLKELRLPIQSTERCVKSLQDERVAKNAFTERMFCAGDGRAGNDTCRGDSGGPFVQRMMNPDGYLYWTQVGIVSWGLGCGVANTYGFYSHVQYLRSWIDAKIATALKNEEI